MKGKASVQQDKENGRWKCQQTSRKAAAWQSRAAGIFKGIHFVIFFFILPEHLGLVFL